MNIFYEFNGKKRNFHVENVNSHADLYNHISTNENLPMGMFKIVLNGKYLAQDQTTIINRNDLFCNVVLPVIGGKGGFGSMLRAIGAQIEKTTNKEACRDLSGRRLRDVNAEKRIKNWIKRKAEQQKEQRQKKRERLERLTQQPKIDFKDEEYMKEIDVIPQKVDDAIDYVLKKKKSTCTITSTTLAESVQEVNKISSTNIAESSQPCSSGGESTSTLTNSETSSHDSNDQIQTDSQLCTNANSDKLNLIKPINKRKVDEPAIASKKKKVVLWLGDDLDSDDSDEN